MTYRTTTKLYAFDQNNTFGSFDAGVGHTVLIEASTAEEANQRAEQVGVYFDGVGLGRDCECCGSRWYRADESAARPFARPLGFQELEDYLHSPWRTVLRVLYKDGTQEVYSRGEGNVVRKLQPARGANPGGIPVAPDDAWTIPGD